MRCLQKAEHLSSFFFIFFNNYIVMAKLYKVHCHKKITHSREG